MRAGLWTFLMCGGAAAVLPACAGFDEAVESTESLASSGSSSRSSAESAAAVEAVGAVGAAPAIAGCTAHTAGSGFGNRPVPVASTLAVTDLQATPAVHPALDAVMALTRGPATSFGHLATSVRFSTAGVLDVRDGAAYRADVAVPFALGQAQPLRIVADLASHTFSVYVDLGHDTVRLARRYAFRPTTATVPSLDGLAAIVDGAAGQLSICNVVSTAAPAVAYSREGAYGVVPLAGDRALASDGAVTLRLAANGAVLNQVAAGGELAADPSERAYVARVTGGQLALAAYTAALAPRWSRLDPVAAGTRVVAMAADAAGVTLALAAGGGAISIVRYPEAGGAGTVLHTGGTHAAVAADGFAVATASASAPARLAYDVTLFAPDGTPRWTRSFPGAIGATIEVMSLGLGGRVAIGGHFSAPVTFGGPTLEVGYIGELDVNTYLVGLDRATGAHAFTTRVRATRLTGAAGNGARLVLSGERIVTPIYPDLFHYDASGSLLRRGDDTGFYEEWGRSGRVAIGASNRVYWERAMAWPWPTSRPYPYLIALQP